MGVLTATPQTDISSAPRGASQNELFAKASPHIGADEAASLAYKVFAVEGDAMLLTGERDQNFLIQGACESFVLKVTHPSEPVGVTEFQTLAQLHVLRHNPGVPIPGVRPTVEGEHIHRRAVPGTDLTQAVRLIEFVDGQPLFKTSGSSRQRAALGAALAGFDAALASFSHPQMDHKLLWDLQRVGDLGELLQFIDDGILRQLAQSTLTRIVSETLPASAKLRRQVIHNDLNAYNVIVSREDEAEVLGLLDFGDMVRAPLVQDLAVACAYQLSQNANPLDTAMDCIQAYHMANPLTDDELGVLPDLIAARLLTTVLITGWRAKQHPTNSTYILRNNPLSWDGLQRLAMHTPAQQRAFIFDQLK